MVGLDGGVPMISKWEIRRLSATQKRILIEHIDVQVPVEVRNQARMRNLRSLRQKRLVRGHPANVGKPKVTVLTKSGRQAVCLILADYADAIEAETPEIAT